MIRAAFFDVDGTLLSFGTGQVRDSARETIRRLQERGIACVVATGRHYRQLKRLPVGDIPFDAYLTLNGQICLDREGKLFHGVPIHGAMKDRILQMYRDRTYPILLQSQDRMILNHVTDHVREVQALINSPIPPLGDPGEEPFYQAAVYVRRKDQDAFRKLLPECVVTSWSSEGVDVIARNGGKVNGIRAYLNLWNIAPEDTVAFGDGENDLDMLRFAGIGVAMGNAVKAVKEAADYVTVDIDDDGILKAALHLGLI